MSEWKETTLDELIEVQNGYAFKSEDFHSANGMPVIKIKNVASGKLDMRDSQFYPYYTKELERYLIKRNDILIAMTGSHIHQLSSIVGKVTRYDKDFDSLLNQRVGKIFSTNKNVLDDDFIYWFFKQWEITLELASNAGGSANQANISPSIIKSLSILLPPIEEQKAIAAVLSSLDDKIDLLHKQNKTLEAMAETLFRQWFIEEAKEDWEEYKILDIAENIKENTTPSKQPAMHFYHYSLPAFDGGEIPKLELGETIYSNKYIVHPNSILVSKLNPMFPRVWFVGQNINRNSICSTEFQVYKTKEEKLLPFLYFLLKSDEAKSSLTMAASGTSGSHQRVRPEDISNIKFYLPDIDLAIEYSELIRIKLNKILLNKLQIQTLSKLRDTLLPKLMSGEVKVK